MKGKDQQRDKRCQGDVCWLVGGRGRSLPKGKRCGDESTVLCEISVCLAKYRARTYRFFTVDAA